MKYAVGLGDALRDSPEPIVNEGPEEERPDTGLAVVHLCATCAHEHVCSIAATIRLTQTEVVVSQCGAYDSNEAADEINDEDLATFTPENSSDDDGQ